ncbi:MAG: cation-translocating P-type ATPase [Gammaproteobacteria bacterium]
MAAAEQIALRGLTQSEATARLLREGHNDLPSSDRHSLLALLWEVLREPMFALLVGSAVLYALIGDLGEAAILAAFASVSVSIALIQRGRSERVLEALRDLSSPRALVIRDGERRRIPGRDLVRDDLIVVTEGDRVPADALLIEGHDIRVDESLLTGESVPVRKRVAGASDGGSVAPGGDDLPFMFSGTLVLSGTGLARVTATGERSEMGKIGSAVRSIAAEQPRLQVQTRRLVLIFAAAGALFSLATVLLYGLLRGDWLQGLLGGIALGMSMLPEEFPLVLAVFMVMGAWRLSASRVLTRRAAAIETLGSATVLCTDKTGTLTENRMSVAHLEASNAQWNRESGALQVSGMPLIANLLDVAALASEPKALDPVDRAVQGLAAESGIPRRAVAELVRTYPLIPQRLAVVNAWSEREGTACLVRAKGAPETVAHLCRMTPADRDAMTATVNALAEDGLRVLGVAVGECRRDSLPADPATREFRFVGLLALADPLRQGVPAAVRECRSAGIRVIMITGDYPATARTIAHQAGIADGEVLTGRDVDSLDDAALARRLRSATVFARISPNQKLRIVQALKANGEVVAMTGDGVNDAPALKAAHIGIAMGGRGTDVAREASSLVLLDDDFGSVVRAVRHGRRIYDNLRKAMMYIVSVHVPVAGLALLPIVLGWPLLLTPILIAFLELIIDPACSIVLEAEAEEKDIMTRPPRDPRATLLSRALVTWGVIQGGIALIAVAAVYVGAVRSGVATEDVRALTFVSLVAVNLAMIFSSRTFSTSVLSALGRPNATLAWGVAIVGALLAVILGWPAVRGFFALGEMAIEGLVLCVLVALAVLATLQFLKRLYGTRLMT